MVGFTINPTLTTNASGTFNTTSEGYIQGLTMDSPSVRNQLSGGVLASTETLPMWGGVAISELISSVSGPGKTLGNLIERSTAQANLTGFAVFDQAHHAIASPQSPVPLIVSGQSVHFYRMGTGARIPVKVDPTLVDEDGQLITSAVGWDFTNQMLIATASGNVLPVRLLDVNVGNCMTVSYDAATGFATWTRNGNCALILI